MTKLIGDPLSDGVRLEDVARAAGVGVSTVSRALNNPDRVNAKTRQHVQSVAMSMGYSGNLAARRLRSGLSHVILVVLPSFRGSDVLAPALRAIDAKLMEAGYSTIFGVLSQGQADPRIIRMARGGFVDGILAITNEPPRQNAELSILPANLPSVGLLVDLTRFGIPSLVTAEHEAMSVMTAELIRRGRRRIAYVSGPPSYHETQRYAGFHEAIEQSREAVEEIFLPGDYEKESGAEAARQILAMSHRPDATVLTNDYMALAFMHTLRDAGVKVPEQMAVTGFDDIWSSALSSPPLTTYRQPMERLGREAAQLLTEILAGNGEVEVTCRMLRGEFCIRGSI